MKERWKIKTNNSKFTIVPLAVKKKGDIIVNNNIIPNKNSGKILGLKISGTGMKQHVEDITNKGKIALQELQRFKNLYIRIRLHLIKTLIPPIILYPIIPLITVSNKRM